MTEPASTDFELAVLVGEWLRRSSLLLVTAESCTGGLIGDWITNIPGSSDYYLGGVVSYSYEAKDVLLGVSEKTLLSYGAVSAETVREMARGARRLLAVRHPAERLVGLSVSGIAGPSGGMPGKPVGLVWIGLSAPGFEGAWTYTGSGDRLENKAFSARQALRHLLDYLQEKESNAF